MPFLLKGRNLAALDLAGHRRARGAVHWSDCRHHPVDQLLFPYAGGQFRPSQFHDQLGWLEFIGDRAGFTEFGQQDVANGRFGRAGHFVTAIDAGDAVTGRCGERDRVFYEAGLSEGALLGDQLAGAGGFRGAGFGGRVGQVFVARVRAALDAVHFLRDARRRPRNAAFPSFALGDVGGGARDRRRAGESGHLGLDVEQSAVDREALIARFGHGAEGQRRGLEAVVFDLHDPRGTRHFVGGQADVIPGGVDATQRDRPGRLGFGGPAHLGIGFAGRHFEQFDRPGVPDAQDRQIRGFTDVELVVRAGAAGGTGGGTAGTVGIIIGDLDPDDSGRFHGERGGRGGEVGEAVVLFGRYFACAFGRVGGDRELAAPAGGFIIDAPEAVGLAVGARALRATSVGGEPDEDGNACLLREAGPTDDDGGTRGPAGWFQRQRRRWLQREGHVEGLGADRNHRRDARGRGLSWKWGHDEGARARIAGGGKRPGRVRFAR